MAFSDHDLATRAALRTLTDADGISWEWFNASTSDERRAFEARLVDSCDPLAKEPGTPEWRFRAYVTRERERLVLGAFFDLVANPTHWKDAVDAVVDMDPANAPLAGAIRRAVEFFTATTPTFHPVEGEPHKVRVRAAGYWAGPAA